MKIEPKSSDREVLAGLVERVTYQNAESGFCVVRVRVRGRRELVTLVGHAAAIAAGEWITATGNASFGNGMRRADILNWRRASAL